MNKIYIYKIIDNKIECSNILDYINDYCEGKEDRFLINALKLNKLINMLILEFGNIRVYVYINELILKISEIINFKNNITTLIIQNNTDKINFINDDQRIINLKNIILTSYLMFYNLINILRR